MATKTRARRRPAARNRANHLDPLRLPEGRGVMTPPALAKRWQCAPETILDLLRRGVLFGFILGQRRGFTAKGNRRRPRWRIPLGEIEACERRQGPTPRPAPKAPRQKRPADWVDYY